MEAPMRPDLDELPNNSGSDIKPRLRSHRRYRVVTLRFPESKHKITGVVLKKRWNRLRLKNYVYHYQAEKRSLKELIIVERPFISPGGRLPGNDQDLPALDMQPYIPIPPKKEDLRICPECDLLEAIVEIWQKIMAELEEEHELIQASF
jgi:hypothetical protein